MANQVTPAQQHLFRYQSFQIDKSQPLGHGSYGAVYKAKCDQLPCAAKVLHPTILDPMDPGADNIRDRFSQECALLESIRHPNIVQYLAMIVDPESRLPVLLMELLDESLTKVLERSQQSLAYYIQVDICHDVALAIAYLHSNNIIHRDLSSNNVLIIAGRRAKVTDFGMSKLAGAAPTMTPLTMCPGTLAYMPPEALREPLRYTKKLDCFSEGVIMIQVCTRLWPEPGPRTQLVPDSRSPTGSTEMPVLEPERRKNHIDLTDPNHALLPIATKCLKYQERERPTSEELCQRLAGLMDSDHYRDNVRQHQDEIQAKDRELQEKDTVIQEKNREIQEKDRALQDKETEIQDKERALQDKEAVIEDKERALQNREAMIQDKDRLIASRERQLRQLNQQLEEQEQVTADIQHSLQRQEEQLQQQLSQQVVTNPDHKPHPSKKKYQANNSQIISQNQQFLEKEKELWDKEKVIQEKERALQDKDIVMKRVIQDKDWVIASRERKIRQLNQQLEEQEQVTAEIQHSLQRQEEQLQLSQQIQTNQDHEPHPLKEGKETLNWRDGGKAQFGMARGAAVVDGGVAYFMNWNGQLLAYISNKWIECPKYPYKASSLAVVNGQVTAIGGCKDWSKKHTYTNKLLSLRGSWSDVFPPMPTKRRCTTAVTSKEHLIVAGGTTGLNHADNVNTVEVMDTKTLVWSIVASLPHPYSLVSVTICGDHLYMLGGNDDKSKTKSVLTCSLTELLQSSASSSSVWHRVADAPAYWSTCAAVNGQLLAVGGCDEGNKSTAAIHKYNQRTNTWDHISDMSTARDCCLVAVLPTNEMMAVGGFISPGSITDKVEIATCNF